jgi:hypothetical protein
MNFDDRKLDELEKELDKEIQAGARVYMTYPSVVKRLIADLREARAKGWDSLKREEQILLAQRAKQNMEMPQTIHCPTCNSPWMSYASARACCKKLDEVKSKNAHT